MLKNGRKKMSPKLDSYAESLQDLYDEGCADLEECLERCYQVADEDDEEPTVHQQSLDAGIY
jgi:hypothetical protein